MVEQLGKYEILTRLAKGGMADLWLARARGVEGFERHVVIKRIRAEREQDPRMVAMFLTEARLAAKLHHNNIVQVHDVGLEDGKPYFAMEYVHGVDARQLLEVVHRRREMVPLEHVLAIVTSVAIALHHAHEQRAADGTQLEIVHRDITPGNVLIAFDGTVKIADFGIAKAMLGADGTTEPGVRKGKVPYMSPEQCVGATLDRRSDVFGLGILLYELTTARRLFKGGNDFKTMDAVVRGAIVPPSRHRELSPTLEAIILRALERDRDRRFASARALADALEAFAVERRVRTSQTRLAAYIGELFGERREPWVSEPLDPSVDFDGAAGSNDPLVIEPAILRVGDRTDVVTPLPPPPSVVLEWTDDDDDTPTRPLRRGWWIAAGLIAVAIVTIAIGFSTQLTVDRSPSPPPPTAPVAHATPPPAVAPLGHATPPPAVPPVAHAEPPPAVPTPQVQPPLPPTTLAKLAAPPRAIRTVTPRTVAPKTKKPRTKAHRTPKPNWNENSLFPNRTESP